MLVRAFLRHPIKRNRSCLCIPTTFVSSKRNIMSVVAYNRRQRNEFSIDKPHLCRTARYMSGHDINDDTTKTYTQIFKDRITLFFQNSNMLKISRLLYMSSEAQAYDPKWFTRGKLISNYRTKVLLLITHVWICHRRLLLARNEDIRALRIQEMFFDRTWEHCQRKMVDEEKISVFLLSKYLRQVQELCFHVCFQYDEALNKESDEEIINAIGGVVWNHLYERKEDLPEKHVLEFARCVLCYVKVTIMRSLTVPGIY